jgi:hypothetical protein
MGAFSYLSLPVLDLLSDTSENHKERVMKMRPSVLDGIVSVASFECLGAAMMIEAAETHFSTYLEARILLR